MTRFSRLLAGFGFFWMFLWAVVGGVLGARINAIAASAETSWLQSWNRTLLRTAHAHMNSMGLTLVVMGLCAPRAALIGGEKLVMRAGWLALVGVPLFGLGLSVEAFQPPQSAGAIITIAGGFAYIASLGLWAAAYFADAWTLRR